MGCNPILEKGIHQGSAGDDRQAGSLNAAHHAGIGGHSFDDGKQLLSPHAANGRAHRQGGAGFQVHGLFPCQHGFSHGITAHGKHGAAGEKADGGHTVQSEQIQHRLDDHTAADAADRPDDGCQKADKQIE